VVTCSTSASGAGPSLDPYTLILNPRRCCLQAAVLRRMSSGSGSFYGAGAGGFAGSPFASRRGSVMAASLRSASGWVQRDCFFQFWPLHMC
jgi:hypothetical protein